MNIELRPLRVFEEDDFIRENQIAFDKAAVVEFGPQKESVIPREDIVSSIHAKNAEAFRIIADGNAVGGVVVAIHPEPSIRRHRSILCIFCLSARITTVAGSGSRFGG